ncbi:MAG: hypothetical protein WCH74_02975 [Chloroflexota bacterium]
MTTKADYTAEEWEILRKGLVAGEEAVRAASPSGWFGRFKESRALKREWKGVLERHGDTALAQDLIGAEGHAPVESVKLEEGQAGPFIDASVDACKAAAALIAAKADPRDAEAYADVAIELAETAALAHQERGSDQQVATAEAIVLRRIAHAFGRTDYEPPTDADATSQALFAQKASRNQNYE